jgi:predicted PurR-regulated permease PerM
MVSLCAYGLYTVRSVLMVVVIALFLAVSLDPAVQWLLRLGLRRSTAVTIISLIVVVMVAGFMWSVVPAIVDQTGNLLANLPGYLRTLSAESKVVREVTDRYDLTDRLSALVAGIPAKLAGGAVGFVRGFIGTAASTVSLLALTLYFMADLPRIQQGLPRLFPSHRHRVAEITDVLVEKVGGYMIGNITISLIAGAAAFVCLTVVRVPFALPLAAVVAIADLIPMIGATLGAVTCLVVSLFTVGIWPRTVIVLLFFILYQLAENYLIAPRVLRNTVDLLQLAQAEPTAHDGDEDQQAPETPMMMSIVMSVSPQISNKTGRHGRMDDTRCELLRRVIRRALPAGLPRCDHRRR